LELRAHHIPGDYDRRTALHLAAAEGFPDVVSLLIQHGSSKDSQDRWGRKPVEDARQYRHMDVIALLAPSTEEPVEMENRAAAAQTDSYEKHAASESTDPDSPLLSKEGEDASLESPLLTEEGQPATWQNNTTMSVHEATHTFCLTAATCLAALLCSRILPPSPCLGSSRLIL